MMENFLMLNQFLLIDEYGWIILISIYSGLFLLCGMLFSSKPSKAQKFVNFSKIEQHAQLLVGHTNKLFRMALKVQDERLLHHFELYLGRVQKLLLQASSLNQLTNPNELFFAFEECRMRGATLARCFMAATSQTLQKSYPQSSIWSHVLSKNYCFLCFRVVYIYNYRKIEINIAGKTEKVAICRRCNQTLQKIRKHKANQKNAVSSPLAASYVPSPNKSTCGKDVRTLELVYSRSKKDGTPAD